MRSAWRAALPVLLNDARSGWFHPLVVVAAVRRADRDHVRVDRRVVEDRRALAGVARRHDDDQAVPPRVLGCGSERVELVGLHRVGTEGQVHHAHRRAVGSGLVLGDPVQRGDHLADVGAAVSRREFDRLELCVGSDTELGVRVELLDGLGGQRAAVVRGDDAGQVGAVPVGVLIGEHAVALDREVRAVGQLVRAGESGDGGGAAVEQRDGYTLPGDLALLRVGLQPHVARADRVLDRVQRTRVVLGRVVAVAPRREQVGERVAPLGGVEIAAVGDAGTCRVGTDGGGRPQDEHARGEGERGESRAGSAGWSDAGGLHVGALCVSQGGQLATYFTQNLHKFNFDHNCFRGYIYPERRPTDRLLHPPS